MSVVDGLLYREMTIESTPREPHVITLAGFQRHVRLDGGILDGIESDPFVLSVLVVNISTTAELVLLYESCRARAVARMLFPIAANLVLPPSSVVMLARDETAARWRIVGY